MWSFEHRSAPSYSVVALISLGQRNNGPYPLLQVSAKWSCPHSGRLKLNIEPAKTRSIVQVATV